MADAWTILIGNSSLVSGDAWEHLNAQQGGSGIGLVLLDGLEVEMVDDCFDVELDLAPVDVEIDEGLVVEIETEEYIVEVPC